MESVVDIIISLFNILFEFKILNISIVIWAVIPVVIGIIVSFIKGDKNEKKG